MHSTLGPLLADSDLPVTQLAATVFVISCFAHAFSTTHYAAEKTKPITVKSYLSKEWSISATALGGGFGSKLTGFTCTTENEWRVFPMGINSLNQTCFLVDIASTDSNGELWSTVVIASKEKTVVFGFFYLAAHAPVFVKDEWGIHSNRLKFMIGFTSFRYLFLNLVLRAFDFVPGIFLLHGFLVITVRLIY